MKIDCIFLVVIFYTTLIVHSQLLNLLPNKLSEDGRLSFTGLAAKYGYPAQKEKIITEDGYKLTLYHIRGDASRPVLLIHGNTVTSDCWIVRGNGSLAITLAKRGYDVWAINLRGTTDSREHISLNPDTQPDRFFNYSFYEEAIYDIPATVDYILKKTGQTELTAIGHSVGTTLLYILGAEIPEYNDKIKLAISLAPISFLQNVRGLSELGIAFGPELVGLSKLLDVQEIYSYKQISPLTKAICLQPFGYKLCIEIVLFSTFGRDPQGFEPEFQKTFFGHYPGGTTRKIFEHLLQVSRSKKFAKFDYGAAKNMDVYQSAEPPEFDLKKVTMKSALFVGKEDFLGTVADAELLNASLPNVVHYQVLPYEKFNHADFIWGRFMSDNLYPYLLEVLDKYI